MLQTTDELRVYILERVSEKVDSDVENIVDELSHQDAHSLEIELKDHLQNNRSSFRIFDEVERMYTIYNKSHLTEAKAKAIINYLSYYELDSLEITANSITDFKENVLNKGNLTVQELHSVIRNAKILYSKRLIDKMENLKKTKQDVMNFMMKKPSEIK